MGLDVDYWPVQKLQLMCESLWLKIVYVNIFMYMQLMGMCESMWKPDLEPEQLFETISQCLLAGADRFREHNIFCVYHTFVYVCVCILPVAFPIAFLLS